MVSCGDEHTLALTQAGTVWSCGAVLTGNGGHSEVATQVPGLARVRMIAASCTHGTALDADGQVWTWGNSWMGGGSDTTRLTLRSC